MPHTILILRRLQTSNLDELNPPPTPNLIIQIFHSRQGELNPFAVLPALLKLVFAAAVARYPGGGAYTAARGTPSLKFSLLADLDNLSSSHFRKWQKPSV